MTPRKTVCCDGFRARRILLLLAVSLAPGCLPLPAAEEIARLYSAQGKVERRLSAKSAWDAAEVGVRFEADNACRTGTNSRGAVLFVDGVLVRLRETTFMQFKTPAAGEKRNPIRVESGAGYFLSREPKRFPQIDTPVVSAAVRGTEFVVEVTPTQTVISVLDGVVVCSNAFGQVEITRGEQTVTVAGSAPVKRIMVRPWDAVQWALYYPAILDAAELASIGFPDEPARLASTAAIAAYQRGDFAMAFGLLENQPDPKPAAVQLLRSALYLAVGEVEKTGALLDQLEQTAATSANLLAVGKSQRAIVALRNNRREEALALAQAAVNANATSACAAMAMSYVQQGRFDLKEARRWAETAMRLQPESATVRARLAELEMGFGELNRAVRLVEEGLQTAPQDSRLLTVAGFARLTRLETKAALTFFDQAIALDSAAGLPHFGRGLALMRQNQLEESRMELQIAAHLEPTDSLFRSYLGKAFFEEKRDHLAANEYDLARQLDPLDPTPHLYSAFHKLANFRPVEALWDIEDSIRLNDNRAVYRSRLLLDQDQAVRSAGLSQIFNQVGFAEAGRTEAIKSINRDYNNFSAHLLLAGSYFDRPQLNQAVISEELVARLLSPVNINSVRGEASFNEYTSLFDRQRAQAFLLSEGRTADDFIQAAPRITAAFDRLAVAVVYGARYQGGYRTNDGATLLSPGLLAQYQLTASDTLSLETLQFDFNEGDTAVRFDPRDNDPEFTREVESVTQRVGWHHRFGPGSHLIGQFLYLNRDTRLTDENEPGPLGLELLLPGSTQNQRQQFLTEGLRGDLQHIWDSPWLSLVTGGSILSGEDRKRDSASIFLPFGGQLSVDSRGTTPADAQRAYLYSTWHLGPQVDLTGGAAYGRIEFSELSVAPFDDARQTKEALDPKVGLVVRLTPTTTLRGAYFETLGGAGSADLEAIEPTQVSGFNQLFDDPVAARARGAGVGLDQKFAKRTYAGVDATWREIRWPFGFDSVPTLPGGGDNLVSKLRAEEKNLRAYLYQVLHRTATATVEYTLLDRVDDAFALIESSDDHSRTHRVRLGLNYFNPRGWFSSLNATWRYQELKNFEPADGVVNGAHDFWIVDATVGYQFPKRTGYVAFSFNNLFDQSFRYQPVGIDQRFLPDFSVGMRLSLNY